MAWLGLIACEKNSWTSHLDRKLTKSYICGTCGSVATLLCRHLGEVGWRSLKDCGAAVDTQGGGVSVWPRMGGDRPYSCLRLPPRLEALQGLETGVKSVKLQNIHVLCID